MRGVGASLVRIRRVAELLRPYHLRAGAASAAITLATLATLAPPYLAGRAIDDVINGGTTEQLDEIVLVMVAALILGWLALTPRPTSSSGSASTRCGTCAPASSPMSRRSRSATSTVTAPGT